VSSLHEATGVNALRLTSSIVDYEGGDYKMEMAPAHTRSSQAFLPNVLQTCEIKSEMEFLGVRLTHFLTRKADIHFPCG